MSYAGPIASDSRVRSIPYSNSELPTTSTDWEPSGIVGRTCTAALWSQVSRCNISLKRGRTVRIATSTAKKYASRAAISSQIARAAVSPLEAEIDEGIRLSGSKNGDDCTDGYTCSNPIEQAAIREQVFGTRC